jgi:hypothetical protein
VFEIECHPCALHAERAIVGTITHLSFHAKYQPRNKTDAHQRKR